ncbi:hypothetical protein L596_017003 [Steinernema carpocapsae]|uniref:Uncharacterized protein n=1 Tax=Steinernema carpocapsae TaxID=34508 RepID=A0A4U5N0G9_STECR|nr:hypothetical protein L596_017003 [Steinernema carpocapsae]
MDSQSTSAPAAAGDCSCISKLLGEVRTLRRTQTSFDGEFNIVNNYEPDWCRLFTDYIAANSHCTSSNCTAHSDDMLWYVPNMKNSPNFYVGNGTTQHVSQLQVYRRTSKNHPTVGDARINWEETVCLNIILQQLDFYVTCAVCTKTSPQNLQIMRKNCQKVYPSPSRRRMDSKGECEIITFPKIYFAIDNFEQIFNDMIVQDGECVCVEVVARDRYKQMESVIFLGSIRYEVLKQVYDARASNTWHWAQKLMNTGQRRQEFVRMRGPHGKGYAEMAVMRVPNTGMDTPLVEHSMEFEDLNGAGPFGFRRSSDTNLVNQPMYKRTAITPGPSLGAPRNRRWQSDADSVNQYGEVEGNLEDQRSSSSIWGVGKSFGQAFGWLNQKKREMTLLNAYLTYVTLPWNNILDDLLLDRPRRPILTFDLVAPHSQH